MKKVIFTFLALASCSTNVFAQPAAIQIYNNPQGAFLITEAGMTLYTFDNDPEGRSTCLDKCAEKWPPLQANSNDQTVENYSILTREDGTYQWAFRGKPLYTWVLDMESGQTPGNGVGGVWHLARP